MTTTADDIYCRHDMVRADCVDCRPSKPRGFNGNPELHQAVAGPEAQAASWVPAINAAPGDLGPWTTAIYPGRCANCGGGIIPGQQIRSDAEAGGWVCVNCGER